MSTGVNTICSLNSMSFMLDSTGGYFCCTLPRFETMLWVEILESINIEVKTPFETPSVSGEIYGLGEFVIIEAKAKEGPAQFRMMIEEEVLKEIPKVLRKGYEKSVRMFGEPDVSPFPWQIYNAQGKSEEIKI